MKKFCQQAVELVKFYKAEKRTVIEPLKHPRESKITLPCYTLQNFGRNSPARGVKALAREDEEGGGIVSALLGPYEISPTLILTKSQFRLDRRSMSLIYEDMYITK